MGRRPTRERGRPARTIPGTASAISSTRVDRQGRHASASAGPMRFPPAGRPAAPSQGNRAATQGTACGRDARAPGWCRPDGAVEGIRGATSLKADRRPLGNSRLPAGLAPSPYPGADQTRVKQVLFQISPAPALPRGSYESETTGPFAPLTDPILPLVEIFSPFPTFGGSLLSFLQPLRGPSSSFVALRGFLFCLCG